MAILYIRNENGEFEPVPAIKGNTGPQGPAGANGKTPVKGVDYYTETDKQEIIEDVLASVPSGGDSNVVIVELPELDGDGTQTILTDEQISLIFSTDKMVYIQTGAGVIIPRINVKSGISIFYLAFDESLGSENVSLSGNLILAIESSKNAVMSIAGIPTLPKSNTSDNGKFLQVVDGVPTWQSLPIYNGEVE